MFKELPNAKIDLERHVLCSATRTGQRRESSKKAESFSSPCIAQRNSRNIRHCRIAQEPDCASDFYERFELKNFIANLGVCCLFIGCRFEHALQGTQLRKSTKLFHFLYLYHKKRHPPDWKGASLENSCLK